MENGRRTYHGRRGPAPIVWVIARFRSEEMNVDELAAQVRRASELIALCKERLHKAETEVGQILGAE